MSIFTTLLNSGNTLEAYSRALAVSQNNVANASTAGYARQRQMLAASSFDLDQGSIGGVRATVVESARNEYSERVVRREMSGYGRAQQSVEILGSLESAFDVSGKSGLPSAFNNLYTSFSAWAQSPTDSISRSNVIESASEVAAAFRQTALALERVARECETGLSQTIATVNRLATRIAEYNRDAAPAQSRNAGIDAQVHATLEELAEYVSFTTVEQGDGSINVLLEGEAPLVMGDQFYETSFDLAQPQDPAPVYADAPPAARILCGGQNVAPMALGGRLGALLDVRNRVLPSYIGDAYQIGDLNDLARQFAGRVNEILTSGVNATTPPAAPGAPLFSYSLTDLASTAKTLSVDPAADPDTLGAVEPGPPPIANGIPLRLAALSSPVSQEDTIDGASFMGFYGRMAARAGSELSASESAAEVQSAVVAQARELREQISGVSLDEEALLVIEFQRAYQATSRLIAVLDGIAEETINLLR